MLKLVQFTPKKIIVTINIILFAFSMIFFISPDKILGNGLPYNIYVDDSRSDDSGDGTSWETAKKTISAGITAVTAAGIVHVAAGTYSENIIVDKSLTITGSGIGITTAISNAAGFPVFSVTGATTLIISGFTITGASGASLNGGGIYAGAATTVVISESIISNNTAYAGGGIYCDSASTLNISNSTITGNHATNGGGGIQNSAGSVTINNCKITSNYAASGIFGGGINNYGSLNISNSQIKDNYAGDGSGSPFGAGGGIFSFSTVIGSVSINNCSIVNNQVKNNPTASSGIDASYNTNAVIDATSNWWGSSTGPSGGAIDPVATSVVASGSGDKIISSTVPDIQFYPWLLADPFANSSSKPITPEDWVLMDLNITQLVEHYSASADGFNKMLYDNILGRIPDEEGLNNWNNLLNNNLLGANQIVYNFIFSEELKDKISAMSNEEFINFLYKSLFAREPEAEGFNDWLGFMNNGSSKEEALIAFLNSEEWLNICRMFGINH